MSLPTLLRVVGYGSLVVVDSPGGHVLAYTSIFIAELLEASAELKHPAKKETKEINNK